MLSWRENMLQLSVPRTLFVVLAINSHGENVFWMFLPLYHSVYLSSSARAGLLWTGGVSQKFAKGVKISSYLFSS